MPLRTTAVVMTSTVWVSVSVATVAPGGDEDVVEAVDRRVLAGPDRHGGIPLLDDRRALDDGARTQRLARPDLAGDEGVDRAEPHLALGPRRRRPAVGLRAL